MTKSEIVEKTLREIGRFLVQTDPPNSDEPDDQNFVIHSTTMSANPASNGARQGTTGERFRLSFGRGHRDVHLSVALPLLVFLSRFC
jgi:hypothetical protein